MGKIKSILMFARDPGGANVVAILAQYLAAHNFTVYLYGKDYALEKYSNYGLEGIDILDEVSTTSELEIEKWLKRINPDLIITGTSANDRTEKLIWHVSKKLKYKTIAILDQWINYGLRFSDYGVEDYELYQSDKCFKYLPDSIYVMDNFAKEMMVLEGVPKTIIKVVGNPYFDYIFEKYKADSKAQKIKRDVVKILYISEPITETYMKNKKTSPLGYDELGIFRTLYHVLERICKIKKIEIELKIRVHPKGNPNKYYSLIELENLKNKSILIEVDTEKDGFKSMQNNHIICGMSSIFLIEAAILKKPILSIQTGLKTTNPFVLDQQKVISSVFEVEEIENRIGRIIEGNSVVDYNWSLKPNACETIKRILEDENV